MIHAGVLFQLSIIGNLLVHCGGAFIRANHKPNKAGYNAVSLQAHGNADSGRTSVITGANGYIGREIVHSLIKDASEGDKVLCLVRQRRIKEEEEYWNSKEIHHVAVHVLPYNMLDGGKTLGDALECAVKGSNGTLCCVYHVASKFGPTENHTETALDNVRGTEDVVKTMAKFPTCKLVLTSSMAAVRGAGQTPQNGKYYTYEDWNTLSKLGANWGQSYQWSKAESERRAWLLSNEMNVPMVSICPSFVFGPPSDNKITNSFSFALVGQWIRGESQVQSRLCVDVRDIAAAHVIAGRESLSGKRYLVSSEARISSQAIAELLSTVARDTGLGDPDLITCDTEFDGGVIKIGDKEVDCAERLRADLEGLTCRSVEETIAEMGRALLCA